MYLLYSLHMQLADLERETVKWCRQILRNSPTAIRVLKSALNAADDGHAGLQVLICGMSKSQTNHGLVQLVVGCSCMSHTHILCPCN